MQHRREQHRNRCRSSRTPFPACRHRPEQQRRSEEGCVLKNVDRFVGQRGREEGRDVPNPYAHGVQRPRIHGRRQPAPQTVDESPARQQGQRSLNARWQTPKPTPRVVAMLPAAAPRRPSASRAESYGLKRPAPRGRLSATRATRPAGPNHIRIARHRRPECRVPVQPFATTSQRRGRNRQRTAHARSPATARRAGLGLATACPRAPSTGA